MSTFGTVNNNTGTVLSFGDVSHEVFTQSNARLSEAGAYVVSQKSFEAFPSGGEQNPYGSYVIFSGNQATINGLANDSLNTRGGVKAAAQKGGNLSTRTSGISSINRLTGEVTYVSGSYSSYNYVNTSDGTSDAVDTVAKNIESPYTLPAEFTYLNDLEPETTTYSTAEV